MMGGFVRLVINLILVCVQPMISINAYKIFMVAGGTRSHKAVFDPLAEELGKRGHEVTIYSPFKDDKQTKGVTNIYLSDWDDTINLADLDFFKGTLENRKFLESIVLALDDVCKNTCGTPEIQDIIRNPRNEKGEPQFDVMIFDSMLGEFLLPLAHHLQIPSIYLSPALLYPSIAWNLNIPYPYSYLSSGMDENIHPKGILGRALNAVKILAFSYFRQYELHPMWDKAFSKSCLPGTPSLEHLEQNVSFVMINWHLSLHPSAPGMPYFKHVGCLHCEERKPLPRDLEDFMNDSPEGVVYFSMGSYIKGSLMPAQMRNNMAAAFSKLKQKVLWKFESTVEGLSSNIRLINWAPQKDLLGHPNLKLFITHGGSLSMMEAAYNGCPLLGFPLSSDQLSNMQFAKEKGFAEVLDWKTFTIEEMDEKLSAMLSNKSYENNANHVSRLMKDNPQDPKELAAYWVEYVIRHKGASHLKSGADEMNFFQYFLIDVIATFMLGLTVICIITFYAVRSMHRFVCVKLKRS